MTQKKKGWTSPRLPAGRQSCITVKVTGMNLRGTGQFDGFLWNKKEIFTTDFMVAVSFCHYSWTVAKDFESCREFLLDVFPSNRQLYEEAFPKIHDINDDVFVLVSRKEAMEKFLKEIVNTLDFLIYRPLYQFLVPNLEMNPLIKKITQLQAFSRQFLVQNTMEERLFDFFRLDLKELVARLKSGVKVALIPPRMAAGKQQSPGPLQKKVLYLIENPSEYGLSRLCLISYEEFFHTLELIRAHTEEGKEGSGQCSPDFVASIEEIRGGMASHGFSQFVDSVEKHHLLARGDDTSEGVDTSGGSCGGVMAVSPSSHSRESSVPLQRVRPDECLSLVAYERTLDLQLLDIDADHSRDWFIDMLSLLSIKSLASSHTPEGGYAGRETVLRLRHWRRVKTNSSYVLKSSRSTSTSSLSMLENSDFGEVARAVIGSTVAPLSPYPPPNCNLNARRLAEAQLFMEILCESIEIEEERFDGWPATFVGHQSSLIESNTLWLDPNLMRIYVMPTSEDASKMSQVREANLLSTIRGINVDDISEVRPGKISFACDGTPYRTSLSLIGSEGTICLPVDSVDIRNALLRQFQSFIMAYRKPSECVSSGSVFTARRLNESHLSISNSGDATTPTRAKSAHKFTPTRRRSSFKTSYPESLPPSQGSGYSTRRKSTPAGGGQSTSLNAAFNDALGEGGHFWLRKSETALERASLGDIATSLPVQSSTLDSTSLNKAYLFKKLFEEVSPSEEGRVTEQEEDKEKQEEEHKEEQEEELKVEQLEEKGKEDMEGCTSSLRDSPTLSVESYVSDEDEEGGHYTEVQSDGSEKVEEDDNEIESSSSPLRRASAALLSVVRRNSLRRDSSLVEDQLDTVAEQREGPNTVIVGTFPIFDAKDYDEDRHDNHNDNNRSDNASPSVESYQSDEEESGASKEKKEEGGEEGDEGSAVDDEGRAKKGSAIRRASAKMFSLVRRMSSAAIEEDVNGDDEKR